MQPAYVTLDIPQRANFRRKLRIRTGTGYADLTDYIARAQVWNKDRTNKYLDLTVTWLNRIITTANQWHFEMTLPAASTAPIPEDAWWDLQLKVNDPLDASIPLYVMRGPVDSTTTYTS